MDYQAEEIGVNERKLLEHFLGEIHDARNIFMLYMAATYKAFTYSEKYERNFKFALEIANRYMSTPIPNNVGRLTKTFEATIGNFINLSQD